MDSFLKVCEHTRKKLGRQLLKEEVAFLQWMYERYEKERKDKQHNR